MLALEINPLTHLFFDKRSEEERETAVKLRTDTLNKEEKRLFCAICGHIITSQEERTAIQGGHEHTFTNPHGFAFHIGCFRGAAGCGHIGGETSAWTWFRGFTWQVALCSGCQTHLGWWFHSPGQHFHGLILNRLTSRQAATD